MTPFELWRAGRGEEPVVVAELPAREAGPFSVMRAPWFWIGATCSPGFRMFTPLPGGPEEQAAAEECRAALATAVASLGALEDLEELGRSRSTILYALHRRNAGWGFQFYEDWRRSATVASTVQDGLIVYAYHPTEAEAIAAEAARLKEMTPCEP